MTTNILDIANAAAVGDDQTAEKGGNFEKTLPRAGAALLRFRSYVETGVFAQKNPTYKPARRATLMFELLHPDHIISGTKADGSTYSFAPSVKVSVNVAGPDSAYGKLFKKMNLDGSATHMSQLLGKGYLGTLTTSKCGEYVNLDDASREWQIGAPVVLDPISNKQTPVPIPELQGDLQLFTWENPGVSDEQIKAMWDSIYIEKNNFIQDKIRTNMDWDGSRTQGVVDSGAASIDTSIADTPAVDAVPTDTQGSDAAATAADTSQAAPAEAENAEVAADPLAALGL